MLKFLYQLSNLDFLKKYVHEDVYEDFHMALILM